MRDGELATKVSVWVVTDLDEAPATNGGRFPMDGNPTADWIGRAMQGIRHMHHDESARTAIARRLF
ncbi:MULTISPECIES: hypothetical protein [unclassified Burkholderia]|uniref:hypothetical protein n=1 Tax=unclassified Burkholderia TaxID=2613784 RepID=UPI000A60BCB2|nr:MULTISPECIES: hypothetical protein [unclassified Burkholderia]